MTRLPELQDHIQEQDTAPGGSEALELEELIRHIPKLIGMLPDVLRDRSDPRHNATLAVMISSLMLHLDKVQPLALVCSSQTSVCAIFFNPVSKPQPQVQLSLVDEATKFRHLHSTVYQKFLHTVEVA